MNKLQMIFTVCALIGGSLFLIRLVLQMVGFGTETAADHPGDMDSSDTDASFKMLSLLGITAFLMMFGLGAAKGNEASGSVVCLRRRGEHVAPA